MGAVSRARGELRRARRRVRRLEEEQADALEEVSELIEMVSVDELRAIQSALGHLERALEQERARVIKLDDELAGEGHAAREAARGLGRRARGFAPVWAFAARRGRRCRAGRVVSTRGPDRARDDGATRTRGHPDPNWRRDEVG